MDGDWGNWAAQRGCETPCQHFIIVNPDTSQLLSIWPFLPSCIFNICLKYLLECSTKMEGYSKLASLMGDARTDGHFLIFQKFESISAQNLLYLQAEITNLKESIDKIAQIDSENPERKDFAVDWETLSSSTDSIQYEKWLELRRKLKEYCKNFFKDYQLQSNAHR